MKLGDAGYPDGSHHYTSDPNSPFFDNAKADAIDQIAYEIELELELDGVERSAAWVMAEAERRYLEND